MAREESKTQPSLHKYMRRRKLLSKSGFYLEIKGSGEVSCTRDESSVYSSLLFLSIGPNFVAIVGEEARRYLAIDEHGKVFTTMTERKECVFREFLGRNFFSLFRTCHSDSKGRGWYLSLDDLGKIRTEKVSYSNEPQLHFLVKVVNEKHHGKLYQTRERRARAPMRHVEDEPVWVRRSACESSHRSRSRSSSPGSKSGRSSSASPASTISGQSEYGSPVGFLYGRPDIRSPVSVSGRSEYGSPLPFPQHSGVTSPVSVSGRSEYGSPLPFPQHSGQTSPVSVSGRSEYGTPIPFPQHSGRVNSPSTLAVHPVYRNPGASMSHQSIQTSPVKDGQPSPGSLSSQSSSSVSSKGSVRFGKIYKDTHTKHL
ncbi:uncharacterized protein LOC116290640 [Actinia tenebrosa]|uniref:Fibroblast growth factor n=1 Tax=Actinia tenebrosa TaxID=6105 RepID=A0A6P8HLQ7_ACTTE|nr:uncharacterized protein LOC116290640 [Actinia tenebrosa]